MSFQVIISGIAVGSAYALVALAMVIVYKTSEVLNFAQGEMAMFSAYFAFMLLSVFGWPFWAAFPATLVFAFLLGMGSEFLFLRRAKNPTILGLIIMTLSLEMIIFGLVSWKWGSEPQGLPFPIDSYDTFTLGTLFVSKLEVLTCVTAVVLMFLLFLFFRYTKVGIAVKATQLNNNTARLMGIRTSRILMGTWGLASVVGAVAGLLIAPASTLDPYMMWDPLLKGFSAAVLGGMTSLPGAAVGAYIVGIVENVFGSYVSIEFKSVVAFALIVIVLCVKPSGLLARHYVKKV
jgi:branched-chain amino acid transport system permease protein